MLIWLGQLVFASHPKGLLSQMGLLLLCLPPISLVMHQYSENLCTRML